MRFSASSLPFLGVSSRDLSRICRCGSFYIFDFFNLLKRPALKRVDKAFTPLCAMHARARRNVLSLRLGLCQSAAISKQAFFKKNILIDSTGPPAEAQAAV